MTGSPQKMLVQGSLFSSTSPSPQEAGSQECQPRHHHTEKSPAPAQTGYSSKGLLQEQSLNTAAKHFFKRALIHQNLLLGNAVQSRPSWFWAASMNSKFATSTRLLRSVIQTRSFLGSHNCSPEKAAGPAFPGPLLHQEQTWSLPCQLLMITQYFPTVQSIMH